jgi:hypothetical protein
LGVEGEGGRRGTKDSGKVSKLLREGEENLHKGNFHHLQEEVLQFEWTIEVNQRGREKGHKREQEGG